MNKIAKYSTLFLSAAVLSMVSLPAAAQHQCLNISKIAGPGPFSGGSHPLNDDTIIQLSLTHPFPPPSIPGSAEVGILPECFDGPTALNLNNVSLVILITQRDPRANSIDVNYCDFGGEEHVSARFISPPDFNDELELIDGTTIPDPFGDPVAMTVREGPLSGGSATEGTLTFKGKNHLSSLVVGGQELFIHSICVNG